MRPTPNYTYNSVGNILSKTKTSGSGTDTYTYGDGTWKDLLTSYNGHAISYDTIGNPTTWYDGSTMTWANGRRLASISATSAHGAMSFTYDADGLRLTKTVGGVEHKYVWQGGKLISESYGNNTLEFFYDESGAPFALSYNGTTYYYITNLQGDVVKLVNASGSSVAEYSYNAWGEILTATGTMAANNPLRYRGYYYDSETSLYYLKGRYYDPQICRFINADSYASTGQSFIGTNMFAYCLNNPVNMVDLTGNEPISATAVAVICGGFAILALGLTAWACTPDGQRDLNKLATCMVEAYYDVYDTLEAAYATASSAVSDIRVKAENKRNSKVYAVYFLEDSRGVVQYVGRVTEEGFAARMSYHRETRGLKVKEAIHGLSWEEARGLEEIGMLECHTLNRGNPINNQIHGISPHNKNLSMYLNAVHLSSKSRQRKRIVKESPVRSCTELGFCSPERRAAAGC